jgi:prepilin-type N-terminal cleavage/methylation domain-containing protein
VASKRHRWTAPATQIGAVRTLGFTLVEVVVAVVVLAVGLLALAGTSGAIARMAGLARQAGASAVLAESRLERLRAAPCAIGAVAGSAFAGAYREQWTAAPDGAGRALRVIVSYEDGRRARADTYETRSTCAQ